MALSNQKLVRLVMGGTCVTDACQLKTGTNFSCRHLFQSKNSYFGRQCPTHILKYSKVVPVLMIVVHGRWQNLGYGGYIRK